MGHALKFSLLLFPLLIGVACSTTNASPTGKDFQHCENTVKQWASSSLHLDVNDDKHTLQDLLFFLHVPRTGGCTYLYCFLKKLYTSSLECPRSYDKLRFNPSEHDCRLLASHDDYSMMSKLPRDRTSLRESRKHKISAYTKSNDSYNMKDTVMPLLEYIHDPIALDIIHNGATFQVAGLTNNSNLGESHKVRRCVIKYQILGEYVLQVAKKRLDNMLYVGLTEYHKESATMFANVVGAQVISQLMASRSSRELAANNESGMCTLIFYSSVKLAFQMGLSSSDFHCTHSKLLNRQKGEHLLISIVLIPTRLVQF